MRRTRKVICQSGPPSVHAPSRRILTLNYEYPPLGGGASPPRERVDATTPALREVQGGVRAAARQTRRKARASLLGLNLPIREQRAGAGSLRIAL